MRRATASRDRSWFLGNPLRGTPLPYLTCVDKINQIFEAENYYSPPVAYDAIGGPNSNSLAHWLLLSVNLAFYFSPPPEQAARVAGLRQSTHDQSQSGSVCCLRRPLARSRLVRVPVWNPAWVVEPLGSAAGVSATAHTCSPGSPPSGLMLDRREKRC